MGVRFPHETPAKFNQHQIPNIMIKSISSNIRSIQRELEFNKPITVIVGPNRSGKTSILDAITLIIAGFIPRLGKINAKLASIIGWNGSASITAILDNGNKSSFRLMGNEADGYNKKQSLDQDHISKSCFDARLFLNSGSTDRISIIQNSLGATQKVDLRKDTWDAAKAAYDAAGGEPGGFQPWKTGLFSADASEFATDARKMINCKIADAKSTIDQYQGAYLTSLESEDDAPSYSFESHTKDHAEYMELIRTRDTNLGSIKVISEQLVRSMILIQNEKRRVDESSSRLSNLTSSRDLALSVLADTSDKIEHVKIYLNQLRNVAPDVCPTCGSKKPADVDEDEFMNIQAELNGLELRYENLDRDLDSIKGEISKLEKESNLQSLEEDQMGLLHQKQLLTDGLPDDDMITELSLKLDQHDKEKAAHIAHNKERQSIAEMISQRESANKNLVALEAAKKELDARLAKSASDVLGPVMGTANAVLAGILPFPLTHRGFSLGYNTPQGVWVPIEGFSGSETEAALIGFTAGLASQEKFKVAIMDEAGMLDQGTFKQLLQNIEVIIEKKILDQVFIAGTGFQVDETDLVEVIKL